MPKIAIVTDSTTDFPLDYYTKNDVGMVPLMVRFGEETFKDWVEMPPDKFYARLRKVNTLPKTSQPSVQEFLDEYEKYEGYDHIISVHLSAKLSGTYQSASIAAQTAKTPVTVIDGKGATVGTGLIIEELLKARSEGKSAEELVAIASRMADELTVVFYLDTLRYLEMGGRIGKASALAGSLLNIKPLLTLDDGVVAPLKKTKGRKKALMEAASWVSENAKGRTITASLVHTDTPDTLVEFEQYLKDAGVNLEVKIRGRIGSVIGTYLGPEAVAIYYY